MVSREKICNVIHGFKPTLLMICAQTIITAVNVAYKLASHDGMRLPILVAYRFMFGAAFMIPIALFAERKKRPKLTWKILLYGFLCGLFGGSLGQNLYLKSLALTSATFISAMCNLMPAITFVIAICLRLESLGWNTLAGKAKVFGTILGICGATIFTFVKGPFVLNWDTGINLLEITSSHGHTGANNQQGDKNLVLGLVLALLSVVSYSLWLITQAKASETYPCPYSITAMMTFWASIQATIFALCLERNWKDWLMGWDIRLLTVAFAGIVGSGIMFTLVAWCVRMRGPLFVSIFNPLMLVMVALAGSLFLEEKLRLGMLLGSILIVMGLYVVLWGKNAEMKRLTQLRPDDEEAPAGDSRHSAVSSKSSSIHGGDNIKDVDVEKEDEEETRSSYAGSEAAGGLYMCP